MVPRRWTGAANHFVEEPAHAAEQPTGITISVWQVGCGGCKLKRVEPVADATRTDPVIARVRFVDGAQRPIFESQDGCQYAFDHNGEQVRGVWYIPHDCGTDLPVIVEGRKS
jgi:hypothetical protein